MKVWTPENHKEMWSLLDQHPEIQFMAGGTDMMPRIHAGQVQCDHLGCLEGITGLSGIEISDTHVRIGAMTTFREILDATDLNTRVPVLTRAVRSLGSPLIRNMGTIGGNICTASPAGDTLPPLYVLGAEVELISSQGNRTLPLDEFITGPGKTALQPGEILAAVHIPTTTTPWSIQHIEKVGQRNALAISVVSMAALLRVDEGIVQEARLAWGSVGPAVIRSTATEKALTGKPLTMDTLKNAADIVRQDVHPISDVRATAAYRRTVAGNLLLRLAV